MPYLWIAVLVIAEILLRGLTHGDLQPFRTSIYFKGWLLSLSSLYLIWWVARYWASARPVLGILLLAGPALLVTVNIATSYFTMSYFHSYPNAFHLASILRDPIYLQGLVGNYMTAVQILATLSLWLLLLLAAAYHWRKAQTPTRYWLFSIVLLGSVVMTIHLAGRREHYRLPTTANLLVSVSRLAIDQLSPQGPTGDRHLAASPKLEISPPENLEPRYRPQTIVLVLMESWGANALERYRQKTSPMPFFDAWSTQPNAYPFPLAFANSTATDVSVPSYLTGVPTDAGADELMQHPHIASLGKAANYQVHYLTSQQTEWANVHDFMMGAGYDSIQGAAQLEQPIVNDLGMDDLLMAGPIEQVLAKTQDQPLLLMIGNNAMHPPFQQIAAGLELAGELEPYAKAMKISDVFFERLIRTLQRYQRHDKALIIVTGDHGETNTPNDLIPRIANFKADYLRVPLTVKLPTDAPADWEEQLTQNTAEAVQNIDIAPTVAFALGLCEATVRGKIGSLCELYAGDPLLQPLAKKREIVAVSTNEIRRWDPEGFSLIYQGQQLVYSTVTRRFQLYDIEKTSAELQDLWPGLDKEAQRQWLERAATSAEISRIIN